MTGLRFASAAGALPVVRGFAREATKLNAVQNDQLIHDHYESVSDILDSLAPLKNEAQMWAICAKDGLAQTNEKIGIEPSSTVYLKQAFLSSVVVLTNPGVSIALFAGAK